MTAADTITHDFHPSGEDGPYNARIKRGVLNDESRGGRAIAYKLYHPQRETRPGFYEPLIIWSHGLGGGCDGAGFLARYLATHGLITLNIQHPGTDTSLWQGRDGHPWDIIRNAHIPRKATLQRFQDVPFVLDNIGVIADQLAGANIDTDTAMTGMSGHSMGALTTQILAGQVRGRGKWAYHYYEPRIACGILYSPVPSLHFARTQAEKAAQYKGITTPMLHMTGTKDDSPVEDFGYDERVEIYRHVTRARQDLMVLADGDHMVFAGSRGKLGDNPLRDKHEQCIKVTARAYWLAMLYGDMSAQNWLESEADDWLGDFGAYDYRP
jgi:predicted dienelactone hydrolase